MTMTMPTIYGLLAGVAVLILVRLAMRPATVKAEPSKPVADAPGIASHEKWKASLNAYKEGALTLDAFLEAWSGWVVLAPVKATKTSTVNKLLEAIANPPLIGPKDKYVRMHYTCDGAETVTTGMEAYHVDYGWHPVKVDGKAATFGPYRAVNETSVELRFGPVMTNAATNTWVYSSNNYGPLHTAKRKLGS